VRIAVQGSHDDADAHDIVSVAWAAAEDGPELVTAARLLGGRSLRDDAGCRVGSESTRRLNPPWAFDGPAGRDSVCAGAVVRVV